MFYLSEDTMSLLSHTCWFFFTSRGTKFTGIHTGYRNYPLLSPSLPALKSMGLTCGAGWHSRILSYASLMPLHHHSCFLPPSLWLYDTQKQVSKAFVYVA